MALGSHLITVRRLKKYIDDVIGKKANLPDTSKTIIGNISQINSDLSNKVSKGKVLIKQDLSLTVNTSFTLSDSVSDFDYIIIEAYASLSEGRTRKFSTADFFASDDKGQSARYIGLSHYYDATFHASVGLTIGADGKTITVMERALGGYNDIIGIIVVGINF